MGLRLLTLTISRVFRLVAELNLVNLRELGTNRKLGELGIRNTIWFADIHQNGVDKHIGDWINRSNLEGVETTTRL